MADYRRIGKIVIVGGGTAGWITANVLRARMPRARITLIESPSTPPIGVGEALTPFFYHFLTITRHDPVRFVKEVGGSIKLAVRFENWRGLGDTYYHPFLDGGEAFAKPEFAVSPGYNRLVSYALANEAPLHDLATSYARLAGASKVPWRAGFKTDRAEYHGYGSYAFHMDTGRFSEVFGDLARKAGVKHVSANVVDALRHPESGFIERIVLEDKRKIEGDFFVDCTGFRRGLIGRLDPQWESYSKWLPVNAAIPFHIEYGSGNGAPEPIPSYTLARALESGWLWRIPLRERYSAGYVFSEDHADEESARQELARSVDPDRIKNVGSPLRFEAGTYEQTWIKNCIAIGLSSGFVEPLESTSIQITLTQVLGLADVLRARFNFDPKLLDIYNRSIKLETDDIRDFIILHYATDRADTPFWQLVSDTMARVDYPDSVREKIEMAKYRTLGHNRVQSAQIRGRAFGELSGLYVMQGLGLLRKDVAEGDLLQEFASLGKAFSSVEPHVSRLKKAMADFEESCISHRAFLEEL